MNDVFPAAPAPCLVLLTRGELGGAVFTLAKSPTSAGGSSACDIVLPDPDVSRRRCRFEIRDHRWWVVDEGSEKLLEVNGRREDEYPLSDGYRITLGTAQMRFWHAPPPVSAVEAWNRLQAPEDAWEMCLDATFLSAWCTEVGIDELLKALPDVVSSCRDEEIPQLFDLIHRLRADIDQLRQDPGALMTLLFNQLKCSIEDRSGLAARVRFPAGVPAPRLRHAVRMPSESMLPLTCAITPDGTWAVTGSMEGVISVWDLASGYKVRDFDEIGLESIVTCVVTPNGERIVAGSASGRLGMWDLKTGKPIWLTGHDGTSGAAVRMKGPDFGRPRVAIEQIAVTPDGERLVVVASDGALRVRELASGRALQTLQERSVLRACAVTPDGSQILAGDAGGWIRVWDAASGRALPPLEGRHHDAIKAIAVTPDGKRIGGGGSEGTLHVWDAASGRVLQTIAAHRNVITGVAVFEDGERAVSSSIDGTLKIWDLGSGRCISTTPGGPFLCVAVKGDLLCAGAKPGHLWIMECG